MKRLSLCKSANLILMAALAASLWTGCATYSTYTCPDPIGEIVRQDCDDYKVRYESLQASLSVSIGSVSVGGSMGHEQLRDPSELIQMMMQQTLALCHDYNACRVKNEEFSRRREDMDKTFTAVMAILDQLKSRSMSDSERRVLLGELVAILRPPSRDKAVEKGQKDTAHAVAAKPKWKSDPFRRRRNFWFDTPHLAPGAPAKGELPKIIFLNVDSKSNVKSKGFFGSLWGRLSADDDLRAVGPGGFSKLCKLRVRSDQPLASFNCKPKRGETMLALGAMSLSYTRGETSKTSSLGPVAPILEHADSRVWLAYQPDPIKRDPVVRERPWIVMVANMRKSRQVTARCKKDGKPVKVGKSSVIRGRRSINPFILLQRFLVPLPYTLPTGKDGYEPVDGDMDLKEAQGEWKCKLKLDGTTVREVSFKIKPNGLPELHPMQKSSKVVSPWWLLDTRVVPNSFEQKAPKS